MVFPRALASQVSQNSMAFIEDSLAVPFSLALSWAADGRLGACAGS